MGPERHLIVLHVLDTLGTGGAERQLATFLRRSDPQRFRHVVCTLGAGGPVESELIATGVRICNLGVGSRMGLVRSVAGLRRVVQEVRPHVIHATLFRPGVAARIVGRWCRIPVITSLVNTTYEPEWRLDNPRLTPWKVWSVQAIDRVTTRLGDTRYVAITESVKVSAVRRLGIPPERIVIIPRGLVPERWVGCEDAAAVRQSLGWQDAYPVIVNVGRLVPQKGQQYAVRAMTAVVARFPMARLAIAGEGRLRPVLERLIRDLGLTDHVSLLGERDDVARLLHAADIFVFPSLFEGLGNAVLEAMAAGKPCVCSNIPALREVTDNGRVAALAEAQSPASLASALVRLAVDREAAWQLGRQAQAWVRQRYDIRVAVSRLEALYQEVVD
ncbi:MAG: glycosyltransferase [Armatimonadota bacterium]|nr:glycosyltransferase [Armatimonadota bacterium]